MCRQESELVVVELITPGFARAVILRLSTSSMSPSKSWLKVARLLHLSRGGGARNPLLEPRRIMMMDSSRETNTHQEKETSWTRIAAALAWRRCNYGGTDNNSCNCAVVFPCFWLLFSARSGADKRKDVRMVFDLAMTMTSLQQTNSTIRRIPIIWSWLRSGWKDFSGSNKSVIRKTERWGREGILSVVVFHRRSARRGRSVYTLHHQRAASNKQKTSLHGG